MLVQKETVVLITCLCERKKKIPKLCKRHSWLVPNKVSKEDDYQIYEIDDPRSATLTKALYM